jgi:proteasome lid subunit RPN8/RPN11
MDLRRNKRKKQSRIRFVEISLSLLNSILESARATYPRETILLLRGTTKEDRLEISDLVIPPLATYGSGFSSFPSHMLPVDFSLIGIAHSHPSGVTRPSVEDLNRAIGKTLMIVGYPFKVENVAAFSRSGEEICLRITE